MRVCVCTFEFTHMHGSYGGHGSNRRHESNRGRVITGMRLLIYNYNVRRSAYTIVITRMLLFTDIDTPQQVCA